MAQGLIYSFTNMINGKIYIGKTSHVRNFLTGRYRGSSPPHAPYGRARTKYGDHNFEPRILEWIDATDPKEKRSKLNIAEKWHIAEARKTYGRSMVYNITDGGDGGPENSKIAELWKTEEFSTMMSESQLALWSDPEHVAMRIARMKEAHKDPEVKLAKSKRMTGLWSDPAKREANRQKNKEYWNNPDNIRNTCPHCGKVGLGSIMKRWHYDKCKFKSTTSILAPAIQE